MPGQLVDQVSFLFALNVNVIFDTASKPRRYRGMQSINKMMNGENMTHLL